jgi:DNA ligase (NAD+)
MEIGLAEATIELLYNKKLLNDPADYYSLKREDLVNLERFGEKSAENLISSIEQSKKVSFERVLFALGIRYVGETVAKKIARHFGTIDAIISASFEELTRVDEIGDVIAAGIIKFFEISGNRILVDKLRSAGVQMSTYNEREKISTGNLNGLSFVVSGVFKKFTREEIKAFIEENGGKVISSISRNTSYLVAGENMGLPSWKKHMSFQCQ